MLQKQKTRKLKWEEYSILMHGESQREDEKGKKVNERNRRKQVTMIHDVRS